MGIREITLKVGVPYHLCKARACIRMAQKRFRKEDDKLCIAVIRLGLILSVQKDKPVSENRDGFACAGHGTKGNSKHHRIQRGGCRHT
jgi:hypothetical protein